MVNVLAIFAGAGAGGVARYLLSTAVQSLTPAFPAGTLAVNVIGCFLVGVLATLFDGAWSGRETWRLGIIVGVLGGFTTFSAFGRETFQLLEQRNFALATLNIMLSNILGLAAVWIGWLSALRFAPRG